MPEYKRENDRLQVFEQRASDYLWRIERDKIPFSFDKFEQEVFGERSNSDPIKLLDYILKIKDELAAGGNHGNSTFYDYLSVLIRAYKPKALLHEVDDTWLRSFEKWQRSSRDIADGGLSVNMRTLRAACNRAIEKDKIMPRKWYPFAEYSMSHMVKSKAKKALEIDEIKLIEACLLDSDKQIFARDIFLFSFYVRGINFADIAELKKSDLQNGRIYYMRKKTHKQFSIAITEKAAEIIKRYEWVPGIYLFPIYREDLHKTDQQKYDRKKLVVWQINKALKIIGRKVGLQAENITMYTARHTYATGLKKKGVSIGVISEALGHSDIRTTEGYLKSFGDEVIDRADELLL